jgi:hypothetical protein
MLRAPRARRRWLRSRSGSSRAPTATTATPVTRLRVCSSSRRARSATPSGLTRTFTGGEWDTLHDTSRVNIAAQQTDGTYELYDFVSLSTDPAWEQLNYQRLRMGIVSNARALMRPFNFRSLGEPHIFDKVNDVITSYMQSLYDGGALFGGTPADAYTVDTTYGPGQVNTPDTVAAEKMRAAIRYVPAPHIGEIELVVTSEGIVA